MTTPCSKMSSSNIWDPCYEYQFGQTELEGIMEVAFGTMLVFDGVLGVAFEYRKRSEYGFHAFFLSEGSKLITSAVVKTATIWGPCLMGVASCSISRLASRNIRRLRGYQNN